MFISILKFSGRLKLAGAALYEPLPSDDCLKLAGAALYEPLPADDCLKLAGAALYEPLPADDDDCLKQKDECASKSCFQSSKCIC